MIYFDYPLTILQNFEKTIWSHKTWMKFIGTFVFSKFWRIVSSYAICRAAPLPWFLEVTQKTEMP